MSKMIGQMLRDSNDVVLTFFREWSWAVFLGPQPFTSGQ